MRAAAGRATAAVALQLALGGSLALVLGLALGYLSRDVHVVGLAPLVIGLGAGAGVGLVALLFGGPWRAAALGPVVAAAVTGWGAFQAMEDHHFQGIFREQLARSRAVGDVVPPGLLGDPDGFAFLSRDADRLLEATAVAQVGQGGLVGRWLMRAERGVRLVGPMVGGRALPVGQGGAVAWAVVELTLAAFVATRVVRRARRAAEARGASDTPAPATTRES